MKPTEDATIERQNARVADRDPERWRRAMTRRDRPAGPGALVGVPDAPDLPSGWCRREGSEDEVVFVREGGQLRVSARPEGNAWRIYGRQRSGEAEHVTAVGGVSTREEALRCLVDAMERINDTLATADWDGRICLTDAVDGVCEHDASAIDHLVQ
ncbi:hypothetical protein [Halostella salina]|uniref:hypothetical protein n=1 Tax=Halostella salina TaxID=1547897 RepID=UPI000EF7C941|nr:hypothetical protein [Halostella salina]